MVKVNADLVLELSKNEKLMKRVAKDKVNGLRDVTLDVIHSAITSSNWHSEIIESLPMLERCRIEEEVYDDEFRKQVFAELCRV